jgi:hypothetical protein
LSWGLACERGYLLTAAWRRIRVMAQFHSASQEMCRSLMGQSPAT